MRAARRRDQRGSVIVEFAIIFPLIILPLIMGIIQYGYRYWALQTASATAREAARRLAVGTDPACTSAEVKASSSRAATGPVTVTWTPTTLAVGTTITVTVAFDSLDMKIVPVPDGGRVSQTAQATIQKVRAGTAADPYLTC